MSKETEFYNYITTLPETTLSQVRGKPHEVLKLIDEYPQNFMNIGPHKGKQIVTRIKEKAPKTMIELGGYLGYSAVLFANEIADDPDAKYYSFELNPEFAKIATYVIDLAGLLDKVEIIVGRASYTLPAFRQRLFSENKHYTGLDFIFIDHWKDLYVPDLRVLESLNLIAPGTLIVADNIITPGVPEYVVYVNFSPDEKKLYNETTKNPEGKEFIGRWNILYDTKTIEVATANHKDAIEVTKCVDYFSG